MNELADKSIDIFHTTPERARKMLADPERFLPHTAQIHVGDDPSGSTRVVISARTLAGAGQSGVINDFDIVVVFVPVIITQVVRHAIRSL